MNFDAKFLNGLLNIHTAMPEFDPRAANVGI